MNVFFPTQSPAQPLLNLPPAGSFVSPSPIFRPMLLRGLKVHPQHPFQFEFVVDSGDTEFKDQDLRAKSQQLIKYFLASLAIPEEDLWVNLSPHEPDRIIPAEFAKTEMGRDLLAQDYLLKQLTASLLYPENELGQTFWNRIRKEAYSRYGTTEIPTDTFHKVWIVPDQVVVYENGRVAFVVEGRLKVMMEGDYWALEQSRKDSKWNVGRGELNIQR